jgi:DNA-binding MarR family transcriptional regulator
VDAALVTEGPDDLIHQPVRLKIMAALTALDSCEEGLDFTWLKRLTGATDGNLGAHLDQLARAGYIEATRPPSAGARAPR